MLLYKNIPNIVSILGVVPLAMLSLHLGMTEAAVDKKIDNIEATMSSVLQQAESRPSTYAAAVALANQRIMERGPSAKEQVHAG